MPQHAAVDDCGMETKGAFIFEGYVQKVVGAAFVASGFHFSGGQRCSSSPPKRSTRTSLPSNATANAWIGSAPTARSSAL